MSFHDVRLSVRSNDYYEAQEALNMLRHMDTVCGDDIDMRSASLLKHHENSKYKLKQRLSDEDSD